MVYFSPRGLCRFAVLLVVPLLIGLLPAAPPAQSQPPAQAPAACAFAPLPASEAELSRSAKHAAFAAVLTPDGRYGDYTFPLTSPFAPSENLIPPVLLKSIAGIESDWTQYANGQTQVNWTSCDYGMLQINAVHTAIFAYTPSLLSTTRGNIAAGALVFSQLWDAGSDGPLPIVNDLDPQWLFHWYYPGTSYNSGPQADGTWVNNPNCGGPLNCGPFISFLPSRSGTVDWLGTTVQRTDFPYQELLLYNLQHPRFPDAAQWVVTDLGLLRVTRPFDYGIRPDDALFLTADGRSQEPNLLLFRHRASQPSVGLPSQGITFEYDLPLGGAVTIEVLGVQYRPEGTILIPKQTLLNAATRQAGWHFEQLRLTVPLDASDVYRIRVERGTPDTPSSFVGQYVQRLNPLSDPFASAAATRLYLPLVRRSDTTPAVTNLLRNGDFRKEAPHNPQLPDYWEIQAIAPEPPLPTPLIAYDSAQGDLRLRAGPRARSELRQRVRVAANRHYQLRVELQSTVAIANLSTRFRLRVRSVTEAGTPWTALQVITPSPGQMTYTLTAEFVADQEEQQISLLATFPAGDTSSAWTLRAVVLTQIGGTSNGAPTPTATPAPTATPVPTGTPIACPPQQLCLEPTQAPAHLEEHMP